MRKNRCQEVSYIPNILHFRVSIIQAKNETTFCTSFSFNGTDASATMYND